ncbi:Chaperonin-like RbcX [Gossypium australe]|uniref:Chaperonin-like RbcX n=1 Tax=Gossypium australe TaxID=47621 RepID=A0A5B6XA78_9ROSI|nr:Chaperonin-like RbcX [Gossypium australe]
MVGALSMVGSSVMDSQAGPCLCLDALPSTNMNLKTGAELVMQRRHSMKRKHVMARPGCLEFSSSFVGSWHDSRLSSKVIPGIMSKNLRKQRKDRKLVVVDNLGGQYEDTFSDVKTERQELAERVMITRLHLYGKWIKKCDHAQIYKEISDENLELMRERLIETVVWPSDDTNTEKIG